MKHMKIPQIFYLRKATFNCRDAKGNSVRQVVYIYWNYRNTIRGICDTTSRHRVKNEILNANPEAEFLR